METRQELKDMALYIAEVEKWASESPITWHKAGDAVYETIGTHTEDMGGRFVELARKLELHELADSVETALLEGEYGNKADGEEHDSISFWEHVASQVQA